MGATQGCCISRPSGTNSPYVGGVGASGSARAINDPAHTSVPSASSQPGGDEPLPSPASGPPRPRRHRNTPLAQHINKPLRRHEWSSRNRIWTRAALRRERADFFDTRVTGRQEVWQALRAALEVLWVADAAAAASARNGGRVPDQDASDHDGPSDEDPAAVALATAQSIISAADITLPTGDLAQGAYDALGNYYSMPDHIVSDPLNVSTRPDSVADDDGMGDTKADLTAGEETTEEGDVDTDDQTTRRREEKGKAVVDVRDLIKIQARLSDGSKDVVVMIGKDTTVRGVARQLAEEANVRLEPY